MLLSDYIHCMIETLMGMIIVGVGSIIFILSQGMIICITDNYGKHDLQHQAVQIECAFIIREGICVIIDAFEGNAYGLGIGTSRLHVPSSFVTTKPSRTGFNRLNWLRKAECIPYEHWA